MAALIGVAGAERADHVLEHAGRAALRRPWHRLIKSGDPAACVALGFAGERGGVVVDDETGVIAALDGELFRDEGIVSGSSGARLILERYLREGERFDPGDGWFAAAIWDPRRRALVFVSDLIGHRPLYYARRNGTILFASELKSLVAAGLEPKLDLQACAEMLAYESSVGERTPLDGVRLLDPATTLVVPLGGRERAHERWHYRVEPAAGGDERELVEEFGRLLEQAVARRTDESTALALSGGLDSRCLAVVLSGGVPHQLAYTYGAQGSEDLELGTKVAHRTELEHRPRVLERGYIARGAVETVSAAEGQVRCFHSHHLALRELRTEGVRAVLIGFAGDAVVRAAPVATADSEADFAAAFHDARTSSISDHLAAQVLEPAFAAALRGRARDALTAQLEAEEGGRAERALQYLVRQTLRRKTLPGAQLFFDDVAPRDPYADRDLIEFCRGLPVAARQAGSLQRAYLSRFPGLAGLTSPKDGLPPGLSGARRKAAAVAVRARRSARARIDARLGVSWLPDRRGLGDYATDLRASGSGLLGVLLEARTLSRGQLREDAVRRLVAETLSGRARHTQELGMLLTLELFQRQFVDGESAAVAA